MSSNDLVYRTAREWREADGGQLFGGFARVLQPSPGGIVYRDQPIARANAAARYPSPTKRHESRQARSAPDATQATSRRPRWTQDRIDALPRTSGTLTRIGDAIVSGRKNNPYVPCVCTGGSERCMRRIYVAASVYASAQRPKSCKPCAGKRQAAAFTTKGYANAREYAAAERGKAA